MGPIDKLRSLDEASIREYVIANVFAFISMIVLYVFIQLEKGFPIIDGRLITITAISVGVAYGVESSIVLYISGLLQGSTKNEYEDELWIDILKVASLIFFTSIFLNNSSVVQDLLTRFIYACSFIVFILSGFISINTDNSELEEMGWFKIIFMLLFLSAPLIIIGFVSAYVASLLPTTWTLASVIISIILIAVWFARVND